MIFVGLQLGVDSVRLGTVELGGRKVCVAQFVNVGFPLHFFFEIFFRWFDVLPEST